MIASLPGWDTRGFMPLLTLRVAAFQQALLRRAALCRVAASATHYARLQPRAMQEWGAPESRSRRTAPAEPGMSRSS
eukprot:scaffold109743_cov70-Phaeocystis_antarctica.AAC.4